MSATLGPLAPDELHCWFFETERFDGRELGEVLSADERERAAQFHFERDRTNYVVCRSLLRHVLAAYLGKEPASLRFGYTTSGKPYLTAGISPPLDFNLAHSHGAGLIGVTWNRPVGVDLERVRPLEDMDLLVASHFAPEERAEHAGLPEQHRLKGFYAGWTRKEAFLKATGDGLSRPLESFAVTLSPHEVAPAIIRDDDDVSRAAGWTITDISPNDDFVAALTCGRRTHVRLRNLLPSLLGLVHSSDAFAGARARNQGSADDAGAREASPSPLEMALCVHDPDQE